MSSREGAVSFQNASKITPPLCSELSKALHRRFWQNKRYQQQSGHLNPGCSSEECVTLISVGHETAVRASHASAPVPLVAAGACFSALSGQLVVASLQVARSPAVCTQAQELAPL